jgi:uncharacterized protein (TIGR02996 family)
MPSETVALIHAIHEDPADDLPRLAYADWLEEHGAIEHAEFIRVELQLAKLARRDRGWRPLFMRELALIRAHKDEWFGPWRSGWAHYEVRRGFIEEIAARSPDAVLPHADWLLARHAIQSLSVRGDWDNLCRLLHHPLVGLLATLNLAGVGASSSLYGPADSLRQDLLGIRLAERPLLLSVRGREAGSWIVEDLLACPHLGRLTSLDLSGNSIGPSGLRRLLDELSRFPWFEGLDLGGRMGGPAIHHPIVNIGREGIVLLANHPATARLRRIALSGNRLDAAGVAALIESPFLDQVERLEVGVLADATAAERLQEHFGERVRGVTG